MKKNDENVFKSRGLIILVLIFFFILLLTFFFGDSGIIEILKTQDRIANLKLEILELKKKKSILQHEVEKLKNNPLALEKEAKGKLWLMKKNEKVIIVADKKNKTDIKKRSKKQK